MPIPSPSSRTDAVEPVRRTPYFRREFLPLIFVLAAALALPFVTVERTAVAQPLWLVVLIGIGVVISLRRTGEPRRWPDAAIAAGAGLLSASAFLAPGLVLGHDTLHHAWGAWAYLQAWNGGDYFPIWLHDIGLGMPLPMFYGPLPYYVMLPVALFGGGPAHLLSASLLLAGVVAALTAWWAVAEWTRDRRAALVAAVAWAFAPYRLLDANLRTALGESWSMALLPLVFVAFDRLLTGHRGRWVVFAAGATAAIVVAHPLSLVMLVVALPVFAAGHWRSLLDAGGAGASRRLVRCVLGGVGGIALAGFFSLPLAAEIRYLTVEPLLTEGPPKYRFNAVDVRQVFERRLWSAMEWSRPDDWEDKSEREMPIYFGLVSLAALAGAAFAGYRRRDRSAPTLAGLFAAGLVCFAMPFRPVVHFTVDLVPDLGLLQYPWRFFGVAAAAAALGLGALAARSDEIGGSPRRGWLFASILALAALADGFPYSGAVARAEPWRGLAMPVSIYGHGLVRSDSVPEPWPLRIFGLFLPPWSCCAPVAEVYSEFPEYFTPLARRNAPRLAQMSIGIAAHAGRKLLPVDALPYARLWRPGSTQPVPLEFRRAGGDISVRLPASADGRVEVAEQYFPGWRVRRNEQWTEAEASEYGLLQAELPAGAREILFRFDRWRWDRLAGWLVSLAAAIWLGFAFRRRRAFDA